MSDFKFSSLNLDFEGIQTELKDYFKTLDISYADSSNFSLLIKALSYSTMLNSQYIQTAINNLYLDSSNNIESTYLLASQLGYTPRMRIPSRARVNATFNGTLIDTTSFQLSNVNFIGLNNSLNYVANNVTFTKNSNDEYTANFIIEDKIIQSLDYYGDNLVNQEILLPTSNISQDDISIKSIISGNEYEWKKITEFSDIPTQNSRVYFIEINKNNKVKIIFGNGLVGQKPQSSEKITVSYYTTSGVDGDGENEFELVSLKSNSVVDINNKSNYDFTISSSFGGKGFESINEIKKIAPKYFSSIGNSIIQHDYRVLETVAENHVAYSNLATVNYNNGNLLGTTYLALVPEDYRTETDKTTNYYDNGTFPISEITSLVTSIEKYDEIEGHYNGWVYLNLISPTYLYIDITPYIEIRKDKDINIVSKEVFNSLLDYVEDEYYDSDNLFGFNKNYRDSSFFKIINQNDNIISSEVETSYKLVISKDNILDKKFLKIPKNFLQNNEQHLLNLINHNSYNYDKLQIQDRTLYCGGLSNGTTSTGSSFTRNIVSSDNISNNNVSKIFNLIFDTNGNVIDQDITNVYINKKMVNVSVFHYKIDKSSESFVNGNIPLYYSTDRIQDSNTEYFYNYSDNQDAYFVYFSYNGVTYLVGEVLEISEPIKNYVLKIVENTYAVQILFENLGIQQLSNSDIFNYQFTKNVKYTNNIIETQYELLGNVIFSNEESLVKNNMNLQISSKKKIFSIKLLNTPEITNDDVFTSTLDEVNSQILILDEDLKEILTLGYSGFNIEIINTDSYGTTGNYTNYKDNMFSIEKNNNVFEIYAHEIYDGVILADIDVNGGVIYFNDNIIIYKDRLSSNYITPIPELSETLNEIMGSEIHSMSLVSQNSIEGLTNINASFDTDSTIFVIPNLNNVKEL